MSAKAIREAQGKTLLSHYLNVLKAENRLGKSLAFPVKSVTVTRETVLSEIANGNPWLEKEKLVAKPDQLIKRRGKLGLIKVNTDLAGASEWIAERMGKEMEIGAAKGALNNFIIEPFVSHEQSEEVYVCIYATRTGNTVLFYHEGGVEVGDVDSKAARVDVDIESSLTSEQASQLVASVPADKQQVLVEFLQLLYRAYSDLFFTYLEINPLVVQGNTVYMLDLAAKLDSTAEYLCKVNWGKIDFPPPFGRDALPEEAYIADLDAKSGASLKLTVLNASGRIWTMVAGGGASVVYSDTICDLGYSKDLANYGEYSGAPDEGQTFEYAKTILSLMTKEKHPEGKVLIIGGGIANFTNVAATFKGIVRALTEYLHKLLENNVSIFVRRGGPNFQEGLRAMREVGAKLGLKMYVFGPDTHMTSIVGMALGTRPIPKSGLIEKSGSSLSVMGMKNMSLSQSSSTNSMSELCGRHLGHAT